jgi:hypothetical protein
MTTTHRTATAALLIVSLAAAGAPTASAMPNVGESGGVTKPAPAAIHTLQHKATIPTSAPSIAAGTAAKTSAPQPAVRVETPNHGFDWVDAGIGAAGGIALSIVGLGGALGASQYRTRRTRHTAALSG